MQVTRLKLVPLLALAAAVLVACGGAGAGTHRKAAAVVKLRATPLGKVLVDARGRTLYLYTPDRRNRSVCYTGCAGDWPPLLTAGKPKASGVKAKLLGTAKRKDGKLQVTFNGHPLYFFAGDAKAGDVNGEGYDGIWYAVSAAGAKVEAKSTGSTGTTTTPDPGAGYGYGGYGP
jgi:predicted lipoprotein with Yx(FWY)xxD motif